jgi:hypothetical protein
METEVRRFCGAIMVMLMALAEFYVAYLSLAIAAFVTAKSHKKAPENGGRHCFHDAALHCRRQSRNCR